MDQNKIPRIGIDLGGTKIEAVVMQPDGDISHRNRVATPSGDYQATLHVINDLASDIAHSAGLPEQVPLGIGTPGAVSLKTGLMINCNSTCLNNRPLTKDLSVLSGRQVRIANDADCFALSEASDGAAKDSQLMVGVILGTGVGGGIIVNKQLTSGVNAIRGEWGHNSLPVQVLQHPIPDALANYRHECFCGRVDCVETWISGPAFAKHFELMTGDNLIPQEIMQLYREGHGRAQQLFDCHVHLTALALSNLINVMDPDCIVLGGGLSNIDELYTALPEVLPAYVFSDVMNTQILKAKHGDSGGVRGAAWLWKPQEVYELVESPR